jgi:molybdopterin converting factor small subunit
MLQIQIALLKNCIFFILLWPDAKYVIAVDKKVANENTTLTENSIVALLPPFSGG